MKLLSEYGNARAIYQGESAKQNRAIAVVGGAMRVVDRNAVSVLVLCTAVQDFRRSLLNPGFAR